MLYYANHPNLFSHALSISYRQIYRGMVKDQCCEIDHVHYDGDGDSCDCSDVLDMDWLSSSGNSCEEEVLER